jgi:glycosyltransferase involved in cell wall biosynthesis
MKLSVMMLTYNHERLIGQALESVLAQRVNFDYEIVVGEDCSTDGTRAVLMDCYRRYPDRIVPLLHDRNVGSLRNFQTTLAACKGGYLSILDGDDYWTCETKLQRQVDFLDSHPDYAITCHRVQIRDETGGGRAGVLPPIRITPGSYSIEDLLADNFIPTCSVMYRWDLGGSVPDWFLDLRLGDWPLHIFVARSGKVHFTDDVMAVYRWHSGGVWSSMSTLSQSREIIRMLLTLDAQFDFQYTEKIRKTIAQHYFDAAYALRLEGNLRETRRNFIGFIRNIGLRLPSSGWRGLASMTRYCLFG